MEKPTSDKPAKGKPGITFSTSRTRAAPEPTSDERTFLAVRLPTPLITQLKTAAVQERRKLQDVAEEAITEWLANRRP